MLNFILISNLLGESVVIAYPQFGIYITDNRLEIKIEKECYQHWAKNLGAKIH